MTNEERARFDAIFDAHYSAVLGYAARRSDPDTAQEVASETFLVAWRRLDEVPDHVRPWLFVVARNHLANLRRGAQRRAAVEGEAAWLAALTGRAPDLAETVGERFDLLAALATLSAADRDTLMLVAWDGLPARDAARVAGCSVPTFHVRLHRARARLAASLDGHRRPDPFPASAGPTALEELT